MSRICSVKLSGNVWDDGDPPTGSSDLFRAPFLKGDIVVVLHRSGADRPHHFDEIDDDHESVEVDRIEALFPNHEEPGSQEGRIGCLVSTGNGCLCAMRIESLIKEMEHPLSFSDFAERDAIVAEVIQELRSFADTVVQLNPHQQVFELAGTDYC